jgi:transcriptional regulator with XRE-family HTH domain
MPEPSILGERVLLSRRRARLTQKALAEAVGVSITTISRLEEGHTHLVNTGTLERLSRALRVSADYLLGLSDQRGGCTARDSGASTENPISLPLYAPAVESSAYSGATTS